MAARSSLLFVLIILQLTVYCQEERPSFRILAPQVICPSKNMEEKNTRPAQITISMQTKNGQKLSYRVQLFFEVLGGYRGQQHSLILWDCVRRIEKKINKKDREIISNKNQINVNNTELTQGVYYIFKIIGYDENGLESEPQNFTVTYSDGSVKRTNADGSVIPDDVSFLLLGADSTYADVEYTIEANVMFCEPRYDYLLVWKLSNFSEDKKNLLNIPGNILKIPAWTLMAGETFTISASVVQSNDSKVIIYGSVKVNVLTRGFDARIVPENSLIGLNRPAVLEIIFNDGDNAGVQPQIKWTCNSIIDDAVCDSFEPSNSFYQTIDFFSKGNYSVSADVTLNDKTITASAMVHVDPNVIVMTTFKQPSLNSIAAGQQLLLEATVDDLIPKCFVSWHVEKAEGYEYFDESLIPGGLGNLSVMDLEGNFLSELVDFANTTMAQEIRLTVPNNRTFSSWSGLKGNKRYKFRLQSECPAPVTEENLYSKVKANITAFSDITIFTNEPPIGQKLEVSPIIGAALKTIFKFSTGVALDEESDYPLRYSFRYKVGSTEVVIGQYFENMVATCQLPYSGKPIETLYEVCDSRLACRTVNGPRVVVTKVLLAEKEFDNLINIIESSMKRMEYDNAFRVALVAGTSFQNSKQITHFDKMESKFKQIILNEIQNILNTSNTFYKSPVAILHFINLARKSCELYTKNEEIIPNLLELLESIESVEKLSQLKELHQDFREKREISSRNNNKEFIAQKIETTLELYDKLLQQSVGQNGKKLIEKIHTLLLQLCKSEGFSEQYFDKSSSKIHVRAALTGNQLLWQNISIPSNGYRQPAFVSLNGLVAAVRPKAIFCVGKLRYPSDYLTNDDEQLFELVIVEIDKVKGEAVLAIQSSSQAFDVRLPVVGDGAMDSQCQVWNVNVWSAELCTKIASKSEYIHCKCEKIGFMRASSQPPKIQNPPQLPEKTTTTEMNEPNNIISSVETSSSDIVVTSTAASSSTINSPVQPTDILQFANLSATTELISEILTKPTEANKNEQQLYSEGVYDSVTENASTLMENNEASTKSGFIVAGILILIGACIVLSLYIYTRRKKLHKYEQHLDINNFSVRQSTYGIKYPQFYDKDMMRGDLFDTNGNGQMG